MIGYAFEIFRLEPVLLGRAGRDGDPGNSVFGIDLERRQRIAQEMKTPHRHRRVKASVHLLRLDTRGEELAGHAEAARGGVAEAKSAGISEKRDIESARDVGRDL